MPDDIDHVVVLMLENQSFDRVLGCMKSVFPEVDGVDRHHPGSNNDPEGGVPYGQQPDAQRLLEFDLGHDLDNVLRQIENGCSNFVADFAKMHPASGSRDRQQVMSYFEIGDLPVIHTLAQNFTICDRWFSSVPGPTWPNRFFVHSGTSLGHTDMPERYDPALHIYSQPTVYERLEQARVPWRIYVGDFAQSMLMTAQWRFGDRYSRMSNFIHDAAGDPKDFPAYTFIEPSYFGASENDEHPPHDIWLGEALLATVYNAIRGNEPLWDKTLLVVLYDEHGGFYDHVDPKTAEPKLAIAPDSYTEHFNFRTFGVRVPALLVSPRVARATLHTELDHTSLLNYAIKKWNLGPLGLRAAAANNFSGAILSAARTDAPSFIPVPSATPAKPWELNRNQNALVAFSQYYEAHQAQQSAEVLADRQRRSFLGSGSLAHVMAERAQDFMEA